MTINQNNTIQGERCVWSQVRDRVFLLNPALAQLIDELSPAQSLGFYRVAYPYGALVFEAGRFLPVSSEFVYFTQAGFPLSLVFNHTFESFLLNDDQPLPLQLSHPGQLLGLNHEMNALMSVSAGARTTYCLPKITEKGGYRQLKNRYGIKRAPASPNEHWQLFKQLANHPEFIQTHQHWSAELLIFDQAWMEILRSKDPAYYPFQLYCLQQQRLLDEHLLLDISFSCFQKVRNLKPNPYLADSTRHLLQVAQGKMPGLSPAMDEMTLPVKGLQRVLLEDYGLKKYAPVIMVPGYSEYRLKSKTDKTSKTDKIDKTEHHKSIKENSAVYYSLELPTTPVFSPRSSKLTSKIGDLRELSYLMQTWRHTLEQGRLPIQASCWGKLTQATKYHFYHFEEDKFQEITPVAELQKRDPRFTQTLINHKTYTFPEFAPFFRGCVGIFKISDN